MTKRFFGRVKKLRQRIEEINQTIINIINANPPRNESLKSYASRINSLLASKGISYANSSILTKIKQLNERHVLRLEFNRSVIPRVTNEMKQLVTELIEKGFSLEQIAEGTDVPLKYVRLRFNSLKKSKETKKIREESKYDVHFSGAPLTLEEIYRRAGIIRAKRLKQEEAIKKEIQERKKEKEEEEDNEFD